MLAATASTPKTGNFIRSLSLSSIYYCTMASRKPSSLPPSSLSSIPLPLNLNPRKRNAPGVTGTKSTKSPAYTEAVKLLSNDTIQRACQLALSQRDYKDKGEANDPSKDVSSSQPQLSDYEKLLSLYDQCRQAASVIAKEAPAVAVKPFLPDKKPAVPGSSLLLDRSSSGGALMASKNRAQAKPLVKSSLSLGGRKLAGQNKLHHHRKGMVASSALAKGGNSTPSSDRRRLLQRDNSDSSMGSSASGGSGTGGGHHSNNNNKNKRLKVLGPPTTAGGRRPSKTTPPSLISAQAPPASALQFLNKLNKDTHAAKKEDSSSTGKASGSKRTSSSSDEGEQEKDEDEILVDLAKPPVEDGDDDNDSDHIEDEDQQDDGETGRPSKKRSRSKSLSPSSDERPRRSTRSSPPANTSGTTGATRTTQSRRSTRK